MVVALAVLRRCLRPASDLRLWPCARAPLFAGIGAVASSGGRRGAGAVPGFEAAATGAGGAAGAVGEDGAEVPPAGVRLLRLEGASWESSQGKWRRVFVPVVVMLKTLTPSYQVVCAMSLSPSRAASAARGASKAQEPAGIFGLHHL